jgi:hypothetical protein
VTNTPPSSEWLIPSTDRTYDADSAFRDHDEILWTETQNHILVGDTVFIYGSAPKSHITHECTVTDRGLPYELAAQYSEYWRGKNDLRDRVGATWMKLALVHTFTAEERDQLSLDALKSAGLKAAPQGRRHVPPGVLALIRDIRGE